MASIIGQTNGRKELQFTMPDGSRPRVRLGKVTKRQAEAFKTRIEQLLAAKITGTPLEPDLAKWVAGRDDKMHKRLAHIGLIAGRGSITLAELIDRYIEAAPHLKPATRKKYDATRSKLIGFFGADKDIRAITMDDTANWRVSLIKSGLAEGTIRICCQHAKTWFNAGVDRELIDRNPFRKLPSGALASKYHRYITPEETERLIDACPSADWRLIVGLARYAGLRVPSESHLLTFGDIYWGDDRMLVHAPKTERFEAHKTRIAPICSRLMPLLQAAYDAAEDGQERVVTKSENNLQRAFEVIQRRAGVEFDKPFQVMRASCEEEWANHGVPQHVASKWIGHSITVSAKHYVNHIPDELYRSLPGKVVQDVVQNEGEPSRTTAKAAND